MKKLLGIVVLGLLWSTTGNALDTSQAKNACEDIGFIPGTEKFADCTLKLLLQDSNKLEPKEDPVELCMQIILKRFPGDLERAAESCVNAIQSTPKCMERIIYKEAKKKGAYRHTRGQYNAAYHCSPRD